MQLDRFLICTVSVIRGAVSSRDAVPPPPRRLLVIFVGIVRVLSVPRASLSRDARRSRVKFSRDASPAFQAVAIPPIIARNFHVTHRDRSSRLSIGYLLQHGHVPSAPRGTSRLLRAGLPRSLEACGSAILLYAVLYTTLPCALLSQRSSLCSALTLCEKESERVREKKKRKIRSDNLFAPFNTLYVSIRCAPRRDE